MIIGIADSGSHENLGFTGWVYAGKILTALNEFVQLQAGNCKIWCLSDQPHS